MKKTIGFITIVFCISIYYCSNDSRLTSRYTEFRDKKPLIRFEKYKYGDLYGLSLLSDFKEIVNFSPKIKKSNLPKDINLFILGDSYLHHRIGSGNFSRVNKVSFMRWWYYVSAVRLDSLDASKRNILVIEMSERFVREIGSHPELAYQLLQFGAMPEKRSGVTYSVNTSVSLLDLRIFNPRLGSNLEFNMFDYPVFNYLKGWKADFNYHVFNRLSKDVYVDDLKHQLYFSPTVKGDSTTSSFAPVGQAELGRIIHDFNEIYRHYKSFGFKEVYLSIIPNPVTCIHPDLMKYNELLPQIYSNDSLQLHTIDVYKIFKTDPQRYYYRSDTHWNTNGLQTWIDLLDSELNTQ